MSKLVALLLCMPILLAVLVDGSPAVAQRKRVPSHIAEIRSPLGGSNPPGSHEGDSR
ncbi:hypothetical protein C8F01DRAFT_1375193 [Mycena amicta]|nr:hypothetical protein C8F01DRAFT_1375193 [Mycena amicta]